MAKNKSKIKAFCTKFAGGFYLTMVICIWVISGAMIQIIFSSSDTKLHPVDVNKSNRYSSDSQRSPMRSFGNESCPGSDDELMDSNEYSDDTYIETILQEMTPSRKLSTKETFMISLYFCMFWFAANFCYNSGLKYTVLSSSTIISNTSILFVFIFSFLFIKDEKFNIYKLIGVLVAFGGVSLITITEAEESDDKAENRILGDIFTIGSAIAYGLYSTFLKIKIPEEIEKEFDMGIFFGFVGLINIVILSPLLVLFHFTGMEKFELPNTKTLMFLSINAFIGTCISDYCWAKSVVLLGPLFTQLGICLTIPIGIVVTSFYDKVNFSFLYFAGTALVLVAFIFVTTLQYFESKRKMKEKIMKLKKLYKEKQRSSKLKNKNIDQNGF